MSRAYRIQVSAGESRVIHVDDKVCSKLDMLPVLVPEAMSEVLAGELEKRGFKVGKDGKATRKDGDITVEIDVKDGTVSVRIDGAAKVAHVVKREGYGDRDVERSAPTRKALKKEAAAEVERRFEESKAKLRQAVTEKLEKKLGDLQKELDGITNRATAEALKVKARGMGEIEEIHEDAESGAITIKVKV